MIVAGIILLAAGLLLSAFFSGSETGFYRANRARIVMNAIHGNWLDRFLALLANQPALLVATVLIGNNLANYLISLSLLLILQGAAPGGGKTAGLVAPLLLAPLVFVYGEALPKRLFMQAPNRLLRLAAPLLAVCGVLLSPVVLLLWGVARFVERLIGQSPERASLALGRREVEKFLDESQEVGLLHPAQRRLSQNFFLIASRPARTLATGSTRLAVVTEGKPVSAFVDAGRRFPHGVVLVAAAGTGRVTGYVRVVDLLVRSDRQSPVLTWEPLREVSADEPAGETLMQMQARREMVVRLVGSGGQMAGYLLRSQLVEPLMRENAGLVRPPSGELPARG